MTIIAYFWLLIDFLITLPLVFIEIHAVFIEKKWTIWPQKSIGHTFDSLGVLSVKFLDERCKEEAVVWLKHFTLNIAIFSIEY